MAAASEPDEAPIVLKADERPVCGQPAPGRVRCLATIDPSPSGPETLLGATSSGVPEEVSSLVEPTCFGGENPYCGSGMNHGFSAQDLQAAYKLPSWTAGAGQTVAIVDAFDNPNAEADLAVYRETYDLPPCTTANGCFQKVDQEGGTSYPAPNTGWALEIALDLDMVSAACPKCNILLVEADENTVEDLATAVDTAVELGATQVSNSYAIREIVLGKTLVEKYGESYEHPGVAITAGSGDWSYNNEQFEHQDEEGACTDCSPSFPAGLSSVISVGGTMLYPTSGPSRGYEEYVWFFSGSGCTLYVPKPAWQTDKGCATRADNDVAAVAAEFTPVSVYDTYEIEPSGWQNVGGTSAGAPLVAGAIALQSSALQAEGIEGIYEHPGNWFDVIHGSNWTQIQGECKEKYLCNAQAGYDGPTGVGSPNGGASATPPSATTEAATGVTATGATLNAVVNPQAVETTYYFQYGASALYGRTAPVEEEEVSGHTSAVPVAQTLSGLKSGALYHFRVVAKSAGGTTYGLDRTFSTGPKSYLSKMGSKGYAGGQFEGAWGTAVDADGNVWVSDYANNRITKFSPSGEYLLHCGTAGGYNGQFLGPTGVAVNLAGPGSGRYNYVYVSDSGNNRIQVFTPQCKFVESFGESGSGEGQLSKPMGLAFGRGGPRYWAAPYVLMVADSGNDRIQAFNWHPFDATWSPGEYVASYGSKGSGNGQFSAPSGIALVNSGEPGTENYYVVDSGNNRVQEIQEEEFLISHEELSFKYLGQFGSTGTGNGQFQSPGGISVDATTGTLLVTDSGNNRVQQFALPAGSYAAQFGSKGSGSEAFEAPKGIAVGPTGKAYVVDSGNNRVDIWQPGQGTAPAWGVTATPDPGESINSYLLGVSCSTGAVGCAAVGAHNSGGPSYSPFAERWDGGEWSLEATPKPAGAASAYLTSVSCSSPTACTGVGLYENGSGVVLPLVESWDGSEWSIQTSAEPVASLNALLSAVSCTSANECTAVGWWENSSGVEVPWAQRWDGSKWSLQSMSAPSGAKATYPTAVSCSSSTACTAAGEYRNSSGSMVPFGEQWNGSAWSTQSMPNPTGSTGTTVSGVACSSSTACTAVGHYEKSGSVIPVAERWNGSAWSVQAVPAPGASNDNYLYGVSCASATSCMAAGVSYMTSGKYATLAEQWNGTEWSAVSTPNGAGGEGWLSGGVSCGGLASCAAVGNTGTTFAQLYG